jgi:hypothetical protein
MTRETKIVIKYAIIYPITFVLMLGLSGWLLGA